MKVTLITAYPKNWLAKLLWWYLVIELKSKTKNINKPKGRKVNLIICDEANGKK